MTAGDREAAAAREAVQQAMNLAGAYASATTGKPGVGALLPLPEQAGPSAFGPPQAGDNYPLPPEPPSPLQTPPGRPTYAGEPAGGGGHQGQLDGQGAQWPPATLPKLRSISYVGAGPRPPIGARIRKALAAFRQR